MNNYPEDAVAVFWSGARRIGPRNKNDIFYGRFAATVLAASQLLILVWLGQTAFSELFRQMPEPLIVALLFATVITLAIVNGLLIFRIEDSRRLDKLRKGRQSIALFVIASYFAFVLFCAVQVF